MDTKKITSFFEKKKKTSGGLSDLEKSAKTGVLKDLQSRASKVMGSKLHGLSKPAPAKEDTLGSHSDLLGKGTIEESQEHSLPHSTEGDEEKHEAESGEEGLEDEGLPEHGEGEGAEVAHGPGEHSLHKPVEHMSEEEVDHHLQRLMAHKHHLKHGL